MSEGKGKLTSVLLVLVLFSNLVIGYNQLVLNENQYALEYKLNALGNYTMDLGKEVYTEPGLSGSFNIEVHMKAVHRDQYGNILSISEHAGVLTNVGKNYIEDQLGDSPNATAPSQWIALSNSALAPQATWTGIPAEINANNLTRAQGAYTSTGDGAWTITYTFTASGVQGAQLGGLYWRARPVTNGTLLFADQMTAVNMAVNDTLAVTCSMAVS